MKVMKNVAVVAIGWDARFVVPQNKLSALLELLSSFTPVNQHYVDGTRYTESIVVPGIEIMRSLTILDEDELKKLQELQQAAKTTKLTNAEASCSVEPTKD